MGAELVPPGAASPPLPHPQARGQGLGRRIRCSAPLLPRNPPGLGPGQGLAWAESALKRRDRPGRDRSEARHPARGVARDRGAT